MTTPLDKVLRLSETKEPQVEPSRDALRELVQATCDALAEACVTGNPAAAAELVYAAAGLVDDLAGSLATDELEDWVELTSAPCDGAILLAGAAEPYGSVPYADPGYLGKKRYPIDEKHVKAAWSYINQAKNAARYTAVQLSAIKGKIKAAMKKHGHGANIDATAVALAGGAELPVLAQIRDGEATVFLAAPPPGDQDIPMHHAPFTGKHHHAHETTMAHGHDHEHHGDSEHAGSVHGKNPKEKAWPNKGESDRYRY
jgi:hypothetical protein